ncbi:HNH endonuclease [Nocardia sp. CC227C]|uniref:HNH endonuclease n=1 Tax=Nocardia sp. CC227C TaxID=3044562 RepID=UPI00278BD8DC|nr:HNH endonuclease [Nocardia sp. CC227C]
MIPWLRGGRTDIENLTLVCDRCHAQIPEDVEDSTGWATLGRDTSTSTSRANAPGSGNAPDRGNATGSGYGTGGGSGYGSGGDGASGIGGGLGGGRRIGIGSGRYPGRVVWLPPTRIDPARAARVNLHHHPEQWLTHPDHHGYTGHRGPDRHGHADYRGHADDRGSDRHGRADDHRGHGGQRGHADHRGCGDRGGAGHDRDRSDDSAGSTRRDRTTPPYRAQRPGPARGDHLRQ